MNGTRKLKKLVEVEPWMTEGDLQAQVDRAYISEGFSAEVEKRKQAALRVREPLRIFKIPNWWDRPT